MSRSKKLSQWKWHCQYHMGLCAKIQLQRPQRLRSEFVSEIPKYLTANGNNSIFPSGGD